MNSNNGTFSQAVFFTEEALFYRTGYLNLQNTKIWSSENLRAIVEESLDPEKIDVWAAMTQRWIIGLIFLTAQWYRIGILEPCINQLNDVKIQNAYFQHDGALCHYTLESLLV